MTRYPIAIGEHAIALITIFSRTDYIDDLWAVDWIMEETRERHKRSARQVIDALEGHWSVSFLEALRNEIDTALARHADEVAALRPNAQSTEPAPK
jgi:hypothetical protein